MVTATMGALRVLLEAGLSAVEMIWLGERSPACGGEGRAGRRGGVGVGRAAGEAESESAAERGKRGGPGAQRAQGCWAAWVQRGRVVPACKPCTAQRTPAAQRRRPGAQLRLPVPTCGGVIT
jgi:hypothetical protein